MFNKIKMFLHKIYFYFCLWFYEHSETIRNIGYEDNEIFEENVVVPPEKEYLIDAEIEEIKKAEPVISEEDFRYIDEVERGKG